LGPDRTFCSGEHIELIDGGSEATLYLWSTSSSASSIIITNPGQYSLTVTDGNGCVASDTIDIDIRGVKPKVGFLSSSPCLGNSMSFTDTTVTILPDLPFQWLWTFGDGDLSYVQNPSHTFTNAGLHNVNLQVVSDSGCISDTTLSVYVLHLPVANFNPTNGCENAPFLFHDTSSTLDGSVTSWAWNFGNGNASIVQNPTDTFSAVGTYNVQLIIQTNFGCKDTITKTITIREKPNASFIHNEPCQGIPMTFSDNSSSQVYYPIVSWDWDFGDGEIDSLENPVHTYTLPGIYQAALTVKSLSGCTSTFIHPVELHAFPQPYYIVSWPCAGSPVLFTDSSYVTGVSSDSVVSWLWNFGSHGVFISSSPLVLFDSTGVYSFTLTVNSNAACSKSMTDFITVFPSPVADFTFSPEYGTAPLDVDFTSSATGANTYLWSFGDGTSSSLQNPQHSYLVNGDYNVVFIATNGYNCSDTSLNLIQVMNPNVDMAALSASAQLDGNYLIVNGVFRNYGNRAVKKADLFLDVPGFPPVREEWTGNLQPGVSMNYSFKTQMFSLQVPSYLCISVKNPDGIIDLHPLNDMACYSQTDSLFVSEPFPNPASGDVSLAVVTPFSDELAVAVYDVVGKLVISQTITSVEGVNNLHLNTATLSIGLYTIRVQYRGLKEVRKFVRN
ncbi:MAG: PKD domain-containing protein, partial [Bacteroidota bacterium]